MVRDGIKSDIAKGNALDGDVPALVLVKSSVLPRPVLRDTCFNDARKGLAAGCYRSLETQGARTREREARPMHQLLMHALRKGKLGELPLVLDGMDGVGQRR